MGIEGVVGTEKRQGVRETGTPGEKSRKSVPGGPLLSSLLKV